MSDKSVSKTYSIKESQLEDITILSDKYDMNDSEIVQLGIDMLALLDERNMTMKFLKMSVERRERG